MQTQQFKIILLVFYVIQVFLTVINALILLHVLNVEIT